MKVVCVGQGTSQTMNTLKNLVNKGVKVELGIPYELWDEPSVEVADMKKQVKTNHLKKTSSECGILVCSHFHVFCLPEKCVNLE